MAKATLVILHGWTRSHHRWQPLIKQVQAYGYRVVYLTLPGFAGQDLDQPWQLEDYVSWVTGELKREKVKRFFLLGHSNGGRIGLSFAARKPSGLLGLILVSSAGVRARRTLKTGFFLMAAKIGKGILALPGLSPVRRLARTGLYRLARERDYLEAPKHLAQTMQQLIRTDLTEQMKLIPVPILLVWGGQDATTPLTNALRLCRANPQAQLTVFPNATHALPYRYPQKLAREINLFVQSCPT
jgi:pimeloyl-ACP methyl ester carboxylesterase